MVILLAKIVNCYNMWVRESSDQPRFKVKAINKIPVCCIPGWENLNSNLTVKALLMGSADSRQAALPKWSNDALRTSSIRPGSLPSSMRTIPIPCEPLVLRSIVLSPSGFSNGLAPKPCCACPGPCCCQGILPPGGVEGGAGWMPGVQEPCCAG